MHIFNLIIVFSVYLAGENVNKTSTIEACYSMLTLHTQAIGVQVSVTA